MERLCCPTEHLRSLGGFERNEAIAAAGRSRCEGVGEAVDPVPNDMSSDGFEANQYSRAGQLQGEYALINGLAHRFHRWRVSHRR